VVLHDFSYKQDKLELLNILEYTQHRNQDILSIRLCLAQLIKDILTKKWDLVSTYPRFSISSYRAAATSLFKILKKETKPDQ